MGVVLTWDNGEIHLQGVAQPTFAVDHLRQLAQGHTVHHWYRQSTHTRLMLHIQYRTIHIITVWVRTVKDHKLLTLLRTDIH